MKDFLEKILNGIDLSSDEAYRAMEFIMEGKANDCQIAAFLTALKMKGETASEISGFSLAMLDKAVKVKSSHLNLVDTCGTGGDGLYTFNISTTAAFIAAGAGVQIAKHGNRSVSSRSGSADVLEGLGVNINMECDDVSACIDDIGIGFIFAPKAHKAMKFVARARKDIGVRTVFNILGPITNPAKANGRVLGVFDKNLIDIMANALKNLGVERAYVVNSEEGMDEFSVSGKSLVAELKGGKITKYIFDPDEFGFEKSKVSDLTGGDARENAKILTDILTGREKGPRRDSALINAAAAIVSGGRAEDLKDGLRLAEHSIEKGSAYEKLISLIKYTSNKQA
ncbi:MAG: anthranilate phosphoribosyltransferase [Actinomycetota bacterium]|nr:anthranilate phosphoribosyltransferase [Actinomycetota bacterium]